MADKVVLDGELSPVLPFDGDLNLSVPMDGEVGIITNIGGGGAPAVLVEKSVTANGVYRASDDSADGYSKVTVAVPASAVDTGTKSITANGTHDVVGYASADVNVPTGITPTGTVSITANGVTDVTAYASADVNVPNTYTSADEGKVVDGGALVSQTSLSVTENDTYDTTTVNEVTVNVGGGASYDGIEVLYGSDGQVTDYIFHGVDEIPKYALNYAQWNRPITEGYATISFATKPTKVGRLAFDHAHAYFDYSGLSEVVAVGEYALTLFVDNNWNHSSDVVNLPKFVGYYDSTYSALNCFRVGNNVNSAKKYILPMCTDIPQFAWYQISGTGVDITIGSIGHGVTNCRNQPFGGNTTVTGTVTVYTTGDKVDTINTAIQNGCGANLVFVFKASEATTYGGVSYNAGDTMLTA